uniref:Uncharacterized protein n=1 Tax=Lepeophtheirus salmonis TaxID=72036 RepID=A0A0K2TYV7_LEPSM
MEQSSLFEQLVIRSLQNILLYVVRIFYLPTIKFNLRIRITIHEKDISIKILNKDDTVSKHTFLNFQASQNREEQCISLFHSDLKRKYYE